MATEFKNETHKKIYRISVSSYQMIELIELNNGGYLGSLNHKVYKLNNKEVVKDSVFEKSIISKQSVESIIAKLKVGGFENLKDCSEVENCLRGLDGTTIGFKTIKNGFVNEAYYWELTSNYYYEQNKVEPPKEILMARKLFAIINRQFDLHKRFDNFLNQLPKGYYRFGWVVIKK